MQKTIRLKQMGRQNMIPRKFRLFETDDTPKIYNGRYHYTAKPKPHLWLSFIRYGVILVQHTSKTVTSILILWVAGRTTQNPIPLIKPRDQTSRFRSLNLFDVCPLLSTYCPRILTVVDDQRENSQDSILISCFKFKKCCLGHLSFLGLKAQDRVWPPTPAHPRINNLI